jgi:hypothetical protein
MNTDRLIETLAQDLTPLKSLSGPWIRATRWLLGAVAYLGILTWMMASPADMASSGRGWLFVFYQVSAIVAAATAATAAFASTVPGFPRQVFLLPAVAAMVWLGSLAGGAVQDWSRDGVRLATSGESACVAMIVFGGAVPGLVLAIMLRHGAPLTPGLTAAMGMFATATLANVSACMSNPHPSDAVTLVWHGGTILILVATAAWGGRAVLTWKTLGTDSRTSS